MIFIVKYNIRITSMMENSKDEHQLFDTASSEFYPKKSQELLNSGLSTPKNPYSDRCLVEGLESQISRIREILTANSMRAQRLQSKEELKNHSKETNEELQIIHSKNQAEIGMAKEDFLKNMSTLDRELTSLKRQWKNYKQKQQEGLAEAVEELRSVKNQNQQVLSSLLKETNTELKCKFALFGREMKELKKARMQKKSGLMQELQFVRNTLNQKMECQRKKRCEYEQIVLVLLDKTCEQGEKILRRIC